MGMNSMPIKDATPEEAQAIETTLYHAVVAATSTVVGPPLKPTEIHPKVVSSTVMGAAVSLICGSLSLFHVNVPTEVEQSATVILSAVAGYLTPSPSK